MDIDALFAPARGLSFRRRAAIAALNELQLDQQGFYDLPKRTSVKQSSAKPHSAGNAHAAKPHTGVSVKSGARTIDNSVEPEWKRQRRAGQAGGASPLGLLGGAITGNPASDSANPVRPSSNPHAARFGIASGSQAAVVKIASFAGGAGSVNRLMQYQSREGQLTVEREDGRKVEGADALKLLAERWTEDEPQREPSKDVILLSFDLSDAQFCGEGGQAKIQQALRQALPGHRIAWTFHEVRGESGRVHVEAVISAASRDKDASGKSTRIFDNRKSLAQLSVKLDTAFGCETKVDVRGFAHGVEGSRRYLTKISQSGFRVVHSERLSTSGHFGDALRLTGKEALEKEAQSWKRDLRSREQRDVMHLIVSAKAGTDKSAFLDTARAMLAREFAGHQYAFVLHDDKGHVHVHAAVKVRSAFTGERLNPNKRDLQRWRETLCESARERHILMDAVSRFERANPPAYRLKDIRRVERGTASENIRRRVEVRQSNTLHIPVREEGKQRALQVMQGWQAVRASAHQHMAEPPVAHGAVRLYRADRPGGQLNNAPLFSRDRAASVLLAERLGGVVTYVDISPDQLSALKPSRNDPINQFVVPREMALTRRLVEQPATATILQFVNRTTLAAQAERETEQKMPNLQNMKYGFDDMNRHIRTLGEMVPESKRSEYEIYKKQIEDIQKDALLAQAQVERNRPRVQAEDSRIIKPVLKDLQRFKAEYAGETVCYSHLKENGKTGKVAFVDNGQKVEIHDWKNREAVLAAMQVASDKWGGLKITGSQRYQKEAITLAVEHGFKITNPELQEKIAAERLRIERLQEHTNGFHKPEAEMQPETKADNLETDRDQTTPEVQQPIVSRDEVKVETTAQSEYPEHTAQQVADSDKVSTKQIELQLHSDGMHDEDEQTNVVQNAEMIYEVQDSKLVVHNENRHNREAIRIAITDAIEKFGEVYATGNKRDKEFAISVAAEYGLKIANPELQPLYDKEVARFAAIKQAEIEKETRQREIEVQRRRRQIEKAPGFVSTEQARKEGVNAWNAIVKVAEDRMVIADPTDADRRETRSQLKAVVAHAAALARSGNIFLVEKAATTPFLADEINKQTAQAQIIKNQATLSKESVADAKAVPDITEKTPDQNLPASSTQTVQAAGLASEQSKNADELKANTQKQQAEKEKSQKQRSGRQRQ